MKTLFLLLLCPLFALTQSGTMLSSNSYTDFGAYSRLHTPATAVMANPAALASVNGSAAALRGERKFMLPELSHYMALAILATSSGSFSLSAQYSGHIDYNESQFLLAYGRRLGDKIQAGVQLSYHSLHLSGGYGNAGVAGATAGIIFHATDKLSAGIHLKNPVAVSFGINKEEKLPRTYGAGFGYRFSDKVMAGIELVKEDNMPADIHAGLQYRITPLVQVKTGISSASTAAWFGAGFTLNTFSIDIFSSWHPQLGVSPGILLQWQVKKKAK